MWNHANNLGRYFCGCALYDYSVGPIYALVGVYFLLLVLSFIPYYRLHNVPLILGTTPTAQWELPIVLAYCNSNLNLKDSDKNRQIHHTLLRTPSFSICWWAPQLTTCVFSHFSAIRNEHMIASCATDITWHHLTSPKHFRPKSPSTDGYRHVTCNHLPFTPLLSGCMCAAPSIKFANWIFKFRAHWRTGAPKLRGTHQQNHFSIVAAWPFGYTAKVNDRRLVRTW